MGNADAIACRCSTRDDTPRREQDLEMKQIADAQTIDDSSSLYAHNDEDNDNGHEKLSRGIRSLRRFCPMMLEMMWLERKGEGFGSCSR